MIEILTKGSFKKTLDFLHKLNKGDYFSGLDQYGRMGVNALASATPTDTGLAAHSWNYRIVESISGPSIEWHNTDTENGLSVVILIQYGHGTGTGGYVQGRDFINPTMRPIFDFIANDVLKKVSI